MTITDCTICSNPLDHGPVVAHGGGFAHGACLVKRQARERAGLTATVGCGSCPSCEEGHPERCGRAGCAT
jgi:hypothetical protein